LVNKKKSIEFSSRNKALAIVLKNNKGLFKAANTTDLKKELLKTDGKPLLCLSARKEPPPKKMHWPKT
jgi:hypothetical protein